LLGKIVKNCDFFDCERSRTKTHQTTVYLPSIRQVNSIDFEFSWFRSFGSKSDHPQQTSEGCSGQRLQKIL
jgi:hypothetical protein